MPAGERRSYSGTAVTTTPSANFTSSATSFTITASTGYPDGSTGPFFVEVDSEVIKVTGRTGTTLNVQTVPVTGRGWDGTAAASHTTSSTVNHVYSKTDADEANAHYSDTALDQHPNLLNNARHDLVARHPASVLPLGSPGASVPGDTASAGTASSVARSDHRHSREADVTTRIGVSLDATTLSVSPSSTPTFSWVAEVVDTSSYITVPSTTITIPAGLGSIYAITVRGAWASAFTEDRSLFITAGGISYPIALATPIAGLGGSLVQNWAASITVPVDAAGTVEVRIAHSNAGAQSTSAHLDMYRVSA